jgi:hypothetical protein
LDEIVFIGLGLNDDTEISLRGPEELKTADSSSSRGPTAGFMLAVNTLICVNNAAGLDASSSTLRRNGPVKVANLITGCERNSTHTLTGSFSGKKVDYSDIILFADVYAAYWSQVMYNPGMGFNHDGKISYNDITTFVDSYTAYWNGQP